VRVDRLWLKDFRNYTDAHLVLAPGGLTVVTGGNGEGKTNLLEAMGYLATLSSFRGAPREAMVRTGAEAAVVRAEGEREGRGLLIEVEIPRVGRDRVLVNRQPLRRTRDLLGALRVSVFAPDDLGMVKGGPVTRRRYLDDGLVAMHPRHDAALADLDRILRQRSSLLRQAAGRLTDDVAATLDVWDAKLGTIGSAVATARAELVGLLQPEVTKSYGQLAASAGDEVVLSYTRSWPGTLEEALAAARTEDVRRGVSTVGPHRDDLALSVNGMPARTHASQGEQRSLALALRLATHALVTETTGSAPVLLLDDVFSELDERRCEALTGHLLSGQAVLTTASNPPPGMRAAHQVRVSGGRLDP
jgi:DNA replication and repair protein RecF